MSIRVSDLINVLEALDPNAVVVLSRDPEGNAFRHLHEIEVSKTDADEYDLEISDDGEDPAVVLWPS